ncbi:ABC transporter permease [Roseovarius nitratireducens]|uniref:ABC transporter permease n=1 Tax=Roseovarius nitratireducens TaxID=2044597 RepID=UPI000CE1B62B|nr:ABC transporter permease [Roseovarius nitratireducens]
MFKTVRPSSSLHSAVVILELIYHATVRSIRSQHGNAVVALGLNILTVIIMVMAFYLFFTVLGLKSVKLRGDFLLFMMSGIFLYITHIKALGAVVGSEGPASPMMQHAPMNTAITISSAALGSLYIQTLSLIIVLFVYHVGFKPITIYQPAYAYGMVLVAWFTGVGVGLVLLALKPWFPTFVKLFTTIYQRANMIASGKMFVVNMLPPTMYKMFAWNPLFHNIDQARGYVFINYFPHKTSLMYPIYIGICLVVLGLIGEFYTRRHASLSWSARR